MCFQKKRHGKFETVSVKADDSEFAIVKKAVVESSRAERKI